MDRDNKICATCGWWSVEGPEIEPGLVPPIPDLGWCDCIGMMAFGDFTCQDWQENPLGREDTEDDGHPD